jgi:hypothetical protein
MNEIWTLGATGRTGRAIAAQQQRRCRGLVFGDNLEFSGTCLSQSVALVGEVFMELAHRGQHRPNLEVPPPKIFWVEATA